MESVIAVAERETGKRLQLSTAVGFDAQPVAVQWVADGTRYVVSSGEVVTLRPSGMLKAARWPALPDRTGDAIAAISPDGELFAIAHVSDAAALARGRQSIQLRRTSTGRLVTEVEGGGHFAFAADGRSLVTTGPKAPTRVYAVPSGKLIAELPSAYGGALHPSGKVLALGRAEQVVVFDLATGKELGSVPGARVECLCYSRDGRTLAFGDDHAVVAVTSPSRQPGARATLHSGDATQIAFRPDGRQVAVATGRTVELWDLASSQTRLLREGIDRQLRQLAYSPDGRQLIVRYAHGVRSIDVATGRWTDAYGARVDAVWDIGFSSGTYGLTFVFGHTLGIWDLAKDTLKIKSYDDQILSVAGTPNGEWIAYGTDEGGVGVVEVDDLEQDAQSWTFADRGRDVRAVAVSADGQWVAAAGVQDLALYQRGQQETILQRSSDLAGVAFSPDSTLLAIQTRSNTTMVELSTGKELRVLPGDTAGEQPNRRRVVFSSDGKVLVTTDGSGIVQAWSTESWQPVQRFGARNKDVDFALSPDGRWLAVGTPSGVTLYEVASGKPVQELPPELRPARALSLSGQADVLELLVDGVLHFWHVPSQRLLAVAHLYWQLAAALLVDPTAGRFEIIGDDAKAARANVRCEAGRLSFPLELCRHRRYQEGLLSSALGHGPGPE